MIRVLFLCLGNICRSPMAESILAKKVADAGLSQTIEVDSAGTGNWHIGERADPRTRAELERHGLPEPSRARQLRADDFRTFDWIIAMDENNLRDALRWPGADPAKIRLMIPGEEVPDPYYGGPDGFAQLYQMLDAACDALLRDVQIAEP